MLYVRDLINSWYLFLRKFSSSRTLALFYLTATTLILASCGVKTISLPASLKATTSSTSAVLAPVSFSINSAAAYTNMTAVTLNISATLASEMYITNTAGCAAGGIWESYATTKAWVLGQTNATATVYIKYRDPSLIETSCVNATIIHDNVAPTAPSISISAGATYATTTAVTLTLAATAADEMYVTNTAGCGSGGTWEAYATSKSWTLGQTNATATVYVMFRDFAGNQTACVNDTIIHDDTAPTATSIAISGGASYTTTTAETLTLAATGASQMYITNTAGCGSGGVWEAYAASKAWTLPNSNASNTVYVWFQDLAGNISSCINATITHDNIAPGSPSVVIDSNNTYATSTSVTLTLSATGTPSDMYITNTAGCAAGGVWEAYSTSKSWTLGQSNATATVYAKFRDAAGNTTACVNDTIIHDSTLPSVTTFTINGGATKTNSQNITVNIAATDANTVTDMCVVEAADCSSCAYPANYTAYATSKSVSFASIAANGTKTIAGNFRDSAGNISACSTVSISYEGVLMGSQYANGTNWNDYLRVANTAVACDGTEADYTSCLHAGENRSASTDETSCAGLAMTDNLGLFNWSCQVVSGKAVFYSTIKSTTKLSDLINGATPAWKSNYVTKTGGSLGTQTSVASTSWWGNTVSALPDNSATTTVSALATANNIYVLNSNLTSPGYRIAASGIGFVVMPSSTLTWKAAMGLNFASANCATAGGDTKALVCIPGGFHRIWLEGAFNGGAGTFAESAIVASTDSLHHSLRLDNISTTGFNTYYTGYMTSVALGMTNNSRVTNLTATSNDAAGTNGIDGIDINYSHHNYFYNLLIKTNGGYGIYVNSSQYNTFNTIKTISNNAVGIGLGGQDNASNTSYNKVDNLIAMDNGQTNLLVGEFASATQYPSNHNIISNATLSSNRDALAQNFPAAGIDVGSYNTFSRISIASSKVAGFVNNLQNSGSNKMNTFTAMTVFKPNGQAFAEGSNIVSNTVIHNFFSEYSLGTSAGIAMGSSYPTISQAAVSDSQIAYYFSAAGGFYIENNGKLTGVILAGQASATGCAIGGAPTSPGMVNGNCAGFNGYSTNQTYVNKTGTSFSSAIKGALAVAGDDSANTTAGKPSTNYENVTDWYNFDNIFRLWTRTAATLGQCVTGQACVITDLSLLAADTNIRNTTVDGTSQNAAYPTTAGNNCPSYLNNDQWLESAPFAYDAQVTGAYTSAGSTSACVGGNTVCVKRYLKNAIEIVNNSTLNPSGNNDGLCEAGEGCLYTPNFGSYQGHGNLVQCTMQNGGGTNLTGISMYGYDTNGY